MEDINSSDYVCMTANLNRNPIKYAETSNVVMTKPTPISPATTHIKPTSDDKSQQKSNDTQKGSQQYVAQQQLSDSQKFSPIVSEREFTQSPVVQQSAGATSLDTQSQSSTSTGNYLGINKSAPTKIGGATSPTTVGK